MDQLPDEVLLMMFEWVPARELLGAVSQVCARWAALAARSALELRRAERPPLPPPVRGLRVRACLTRAMLDDLLLHARHLRDITVSAAAPLAAEHFQALARLPHLQHLDVFHRNRLLTERLAPALMRIGSLVINESVAPGVLSALAASERLHALHMYGRAMYFPRRELVQLLSGRGAHLRELTLRCTELPDGAYAAVGRCHTLESLQLYSCWLLRRGGALLVSRPPRLRRLHVTGARMLRSSPLTEFLGSLPPQLEELVLSVSAFGDQHIPALARLPALRVVELWKCRLSQQGVLTLAKNVPSLLILDLNMVLTNGQIEELDNHSNMLSLRCLTEHSIRNSVLELEDKNIDKVVTKKLQVRSTNERYANKYFRSSGEGYRATLFYHWSQNMDLQPLPSKPFFNSL